MKGWDSMIWYLFIIKDILLFMIVCLLQKQMKKWQNCRFGMKWFKRRLLFISSNRYLVGNVLFDGIWLVQLGCFWYWCLCCCKVIGLFGRKIVLLKFFFMKFIIGLKIICRFFLVCLVCNFVIYRMKMFLMLYVKAKIGWMLWG